MSKKRDIQKISAHEMKKRTFLRSSILIVLALLLIVGGNAKAFNQLTVYLPISFRNYCPSFYDDFSTPASGWFVGEDEHARFEYLDGEYRILTKDDRYIKNVSSATTYACENYTVGVDARWEGTPGESYGIIIGSNLDFDQFYLFAVSSDSQEFRILGFDGNDYHRIVSYTYSQYINSGTTSNHMKITRNGYQITLEVNGTVLGSWIDANVTNVTYSGIFSLPNRGFPTSDSRFDNFTVTQLEGN